MASRRYRLRPENYDHLATVVRSCIGEASQTEAARRLGISQSHVSQILRGARSARHPGLAVLVQLRGALGMSIDALLGLEERPQETAILDELRRLHERLDAQEQRRADVVDLAAAITARRGARKT